MTADSIQVGNTNEYLNTNRVENGTGIEVHNEVIDQGNIISAVGVNSRTAATLAAAATYQGVGEDVSRYGRAGISITSTTPTATATVTMEVSHDGVTYSGPTRTWQTYDAPLMWNIVEKYFRIKIVNDAVEAADFAVQVQYSNNADIVLGHQVNEILPKNSEAQLVRPSNDFALDTSRVHIKGQSAEFIFGENNALANGTWAGVTTAEADFHWPTAAAKIKVKSTDAADTSAGLGLQSVEIHGIDSTGAEIEEVLALSGVTPVESVNSYFRVTLMHNETVGTYGGSHQGDIEFRVTNATFANGALLGIMKGIEGAVDSDVFYGFGEAQLGFTTIPLGKVGYLRSLEVIPNASKPIDVAFYEREDILDVTTPFSPRRVLWSAQEIEAPVEKIFHSHIKIKALADIFFLAEGNGAASGVAVSLDYYLVNADVNGA